MLINSIPDDIEDRDDSDESTKCSDDKYGKRQRNRQVLKLHNTKKGEYNFFNYCLLRICLLQILIFNNLCKYTFRQTRSLKWDGKYFRSLSVVNRKAGCISNGESDVQCYEYIVRFASCK